MKFKYISYTKMSNEMAAYISQLTPMEQKVLKIAASHLETSFSLVKSIGFQEWQKAQAEQAPKEKAPKEQTPEAPKKKIKIMRKLKPT